METFTKIIPFCMVGLSVLAAVVYFFTKDYARAVYWLSASVLTTSTIFI